MRKPADVLLVIAPPGFGAVDATRTAWARDQVVAWMHGTTAPIVLAGGPLDFLMLRVMGVPGGRFVEFREDGYRWINARRTELRWRNDAEEMRGIAPWHRRVFAETEALDRARESGADTLALVLFDKGDASRSNGFEESVENALRSLELRDFVSLEYPELLYADQLATSP